MAFDVRAPVGPIQVLPPGLISFLQLKVGGFAPDALSQLIQPHFDILPFWLRATERTLTDQTYTATVVPAAYAAVIPLKGTTTTLDLQVPNREWWHVRSALIRLNTAATATVTDVAVAIQEAGGPFASLNMDVVGPRVASVPVNSYSYVEARDFWMPPGSVLGMWIGTVATANLDAILQGLKYSVFPL